MNPTSPAGSSSISYVFDQGSSPAQEIARSNIDAYETLGRVADQQLARSDAQNEALSRRVDVQDQITRLIGMLPSGVNPTDPVLGANSPIRGAAATKVATAMQDLQDLCEAYDIPFNVTTFGDLTAMSKTIDSNITQLSSQNQMAFARMNAVTQAMQLLLTQLMNALSQQNQTSQGILQKT